MEFPKFSKFSNNMFLRIALALLLVPQLIWATTTSSTLQQFRAGLGPRLSGNATIEPGSTAPPRWSEYDPPIGAVVVNVATEHDVAAAVQYCNQHNFPFLAQNGANGWSIEFNLHGVGAIINLAGLDWFTPSKDKSSVTVGGGIKVNQTLDAAYAHGVQVVSGNCPCVGALGATLGGGFGYLMGLYGMSSDNVLSVNLVTPQGNLTTVTADSDPDLFFAVRGAGPNFGIVTSAVLRSWPTPKAELVAWSGAIVYDPVHLEEVVQAVNDIHYQPPMSIFLNGVSLGGSPLVVVTPFYFQGNDTIAKEVFASLYTIPHINSTSSIVTLPEFTAGSAEDCVRGYRKPSTGVAVAKLDPTAWRNVWNAYVDFQALPGAELTQLTCECYSWTASRAIPLSQRGSFPHRDYANFYPIAQTFYTDKSYDARALNFTSYVQDQWRATSGITGRNASYINFARGDEPLDVIYGDSLPRLQPLKRAVDPHGRFDQWYPIH